MEMVHTTGLVSVNPRQDNANRKLEWTPELHSRFMNAIIILGGIKKAVPSQILRLMNVPGLTRENVGSHLQKYRKLKRTGSQRINKLARLDEEYNIQQRQLDSSLFYSSQHASSDGCHLGVSSSQQSLNHQHYSSLTLLDGDNDFDVDMEKLEMMMAEFESEI